MRRWEWSCKLFCCLCGVPVAGSGKSVKIFHLKKVFSDQYGAFFSCSVQIFHPKWFCPAYQRFFKKWHPIQCIEKQCLRYTPSPSYWFKMMQVREFQKSKNSGECVHLSFKKRIVFEKKFTRNPTGKKVWQKEPSQKIKIAYCTLMGFFMVSPPSPLCLANLKILYSF